MVPEAEDTDAKEVYAFYGLAAYMAQVVEKGLVSWLAILETQDLRITKQEFQSLFSRIDSRTFGQLLHRLAKQFSLSPVDEALLNEALAKRNHLAHQFFADNAAALTVEHGRLQMIEELRSVAMLFQRAEDLVASLSAALLTRHAMTQEAIERKAEAMVQEFLRTSGGEASARRRPTIG